MKRKASGKIAVSGPTSPLQNPFAQMEIANLPDGPVEIPQPTAEKAPKKHRVVLRREKSNRGGKTVVVVSQLPTHLSPPEIENLCRDARRALGCGGSTQGREIELQGDQPARVRTWLEGRGFSVAGP